MSDSPEEDGEEADRRPRAPEETLGGTGHPEPQLQSVSKHGAGRRSCLAHKVTVGRAGTGQGFYPTRDLESRNFLYRSSDCRIPRSST